MKRVTWDDLNALAVRIHDLPQEGNEAQHMSLVEELCNGLIQILSGTSGDSIEILTRFWDKSRGAEKFDPKNGPFRNYFMRYVGFIRKDLFRESLGQQRDRSKSEDESQAGNAENEQNQPEEVKSAKTKWRSRDISLDAPINPNEEGGETRLDMLPSNERGSNSRLEEAAAIQQYLTLALTIPDRLHGRSNTKVRQTFFRLFFTDGLAAALRNLKESDEQIPYLAIERELLDAAEKTFLDYFLTTVCRTVPEIADGQLKLYGEMVPGRPMEELEPEGKTKWHLPNDVYTTYREKQGESCLPSSVSTYWTEYRKHCRTLLDELYDQA